MRAVLSLLWASGVALVVLIAATPAQPLAAPGDDAGLPRAAAAGAMREDGDRINGRKVFLRENCYVCHGGRVGGGMCPSFRDDPPDHSDVEHAIEDGTPTGMPSFRARVTKSEALDIAAYFASLRTTREPTFTHWWEPGVPSR
jgi:mono/diheme cytochrome c family protein